MAVVFQDGGDAIATLVSLRVPGTINIEVDTRGVPWGHCRQQVGPVNEARKGLDGDRLEGKGGEVEVQPSWLPGPRKSTADPWRVWQADCLAVKAERRRGGQGWQA